MYLFRDPQNANLWCWIAPLPLDCLDSWHNGSNGNCIRGDYAWVYRWAFYFAPLWFCLVLSTVTIFLVFQSVQRRERATVLFRHPTVSRLQTESQIQSNRPTSMGALQNDESFRGSDFLKSPDQLDDDNNEADGNPKEPIERTRWQNIGEQSKVPFSKALGAYQNWRGRKAQHRQENPRSMEVFHQALFYLGAFYMTHLFSTINRILQQTHGASFYPLIVLHSFFDPLQGFLNFLVYRRPRYLRHRKQNMTRVQAFKRTLRWSWLGDDDHEGRPQLRMSNIGGSGKAMSSQSSIKSEVSNLSDRRVSGLLLITQQLETMPHEHLETVDEVDSSR